MSASSSNIVVQVAEGALAGQVKTSIRDGSKYFSFQGIPFAKPPVGPLRFKPPEPVEPWSGIRSAKQEGPVCWYPDIIPLWGPVSEDCLFLNVYTPELPGKNKPKAVMFWIHGGGFNMGSGNTSQYGPDLLVTEDVVLVTTNYRLGPFGFLSLDNDTHPGNNGLKDIVLALKWVQRNIHAFNGDKDNVTIFGESAGGACVDFLLISPLSKGLFHKAIPMSGTSTCCWSVLENPKETAYKLASFMGKNPANDEELAEILDNAAPEDLVPSTDKWAESTDPAVEFLERLAFRPVIEKKAEGAFLTERPEDIFARGDIPDIPIMYGTTNKEGIVLIADKNHPGVVRTSIDFRLTICYHLRLPLDTKIKVEAIQKLKEYVFPNGVDEQTLSQLYTFIYFENSVANNATALRKNPNRKSPTFIYKFAYDGGRNFVKTIFGQSDKEGASHGDDLCYLFTEKVVNFPFSRDNDDYKTISTMTAAWSNFAKIGDLWPEQENKTLNSNYIEISTSLALKEDYAVKDRLFWNELKAAKLI